MLSSGHGVAETHRVHHRKPLSEGDAEGRAARRTLAGAILHAPADALAARWAGLMLARGRTRLLVAAENVASLLLAVLLAFDVVPGGQVHLAVCVVAAITIGLWASWIPHHAPAWLLALARPVARAPSLAARSLVHHDLHHARPDVPSAWLAGLAAVSIALPLQRLAAPGAARSWTWSPPRRRGADPSRGRSVAGPISRSGRARPAGGSCRPGRRPARA